jgi:hypothetical protein
MSEVTSSNQTRNQITNAYDFSKIFLFDNKYQTITLVNATGAAVEYLIGTLIGVVTSTYKKYASGTSNISMIGILAETVSVPANDSVSVQVCIGGKVAEEKILLQGSDTLDTVVAYKSIRNRLASDTLGIELAATDELTVADNV